MGDKWFERCEHQLRAWFLPGYTDDIVVAPVASRLHEEEAGWRHRLLHGVLNGCWWHVHGVLTSRWRHLRQPRVFCKVCRTQLLYSLFPATMTTHGRVAYLAFTPTIQPDGVNILEIVKEGDVVAARAFRDVVDWMRDVERRTEWYNPGSTAHEMVGRMNRRFAPPVSVDGREWFAQESLRVRSSSWEEEEEAVRKYSWNMRTGNKRLHLR